MNFVRRFILFLLGLLGLFGLNWFFNPSIDDTEEYWEIQDEIYKAEEKTEKLEEKIQAKKDKMNEKDESDKSIIDKIKEEWEQE